MPSLEAMSKVLRSAFTHYDATPVTADYMGATIPIAADPNFADFALMGAYLSEPDYREKIKLALRELEGEMTAQIGGFWFRDKSKAAIAHFRDKGPTTPKDPNFSKLLTKALANFEGRHGFTVPEKLPTFAGFVYGNVFKETIQNGMHFKDIGAGEKHGEFTHRLQWYAVVNAGALQTVPKHQAGAVFKAIARWLNKRRNDSAATSSLIQLWNYMFDMNAPLAAEGGGLTPDDWRSPENFNGWLTSDAEPDFCPLLRSFLRSRQTKRQTFAIEDYFKKKFGEKEGGALFLEFTGGAPRQSARIVFEGGKTPVYAPFKSD